MKSYLFETCTNLVSARTHIAHGDVNSYQQALWNAKNVCYRVDRALAAKIDSIWFAEPYSSTPVEQLLEELMIQLPIQEICDLIADR